MAVIRDELTLVDRFTSTFERFTNLASRSVDSATQLESANESLAERARAGSNAVSEAASSYMEAYNAALEAGLSAAEGFEAATAATERYRDSVVDVAESSGELDSSLATMSGSAIDVATNISELSDEIVQSTVTAADFERQIRQTVTELAGQNALLSEATTTYQELVESQGASSAAAMEQRQTLNTLTDSVTQLVERYDELNSELDEFNRTNPSQTLNSANDAANMAASDGFSKLLARVTRLGLAFLSIRSFVGLLGQALNENTYEIKFGAVFGEEYGAAALSWVRDQANAFGRLTETVAQSTTQFSRVTSDPQTISNLNELADKFARFSQSGDFTQSANAITQALRTGRLRELSTQTGISTSLLERSGATEAFNAGDVQGFIDALNRAAEQAGITQEAYERMLDTPQATLDRFVNTLKNSATEAAGRFIEAFSPAFARLDEWLTSDNASRFFEAFGIAVEFAAEVLIYAVDALERFGNFVNDNLTGILIAAGAAAAVFAGFLAAIAISAAVANLPIILLVGLVALLVSAFIDLGGTAEEAFGIIGGLFGGLYAFVANIIGELYNLFVSFAEFIANVFVDPIGSIWRLFANMGDFVIGIIENVARAIDAVFGSNLADAVGTFRGNFQAAVEERYGTPAVQFERYQQMDIADVVNQFSTAGAELGRKIDNIDLTLGSTDFSGGFDISDLTGSSNLVPVDIKKNSDNKVSLADEDLRLLVSLAEDRYVNTVNVTPIAPVITVHATNNNGEPLNENSIAESLRVMLEAQIAGHTSKSYV